MSDQTQDLPEPEPEEETPPLFITIKGDTMRVLAEQLEAAALHGYRPVGAPVVWNSELHMLCSLETQNKNTLNALYRQSYLEHRQHMRDLEAHDTVKVPLLEDIASSHPTVAKIGFWLRVWRAITNKN